MCFKLLLFGGKQLKLRQQPKNYQKVGPQFHKAWFPRLNVNLNERCYWGDKAYSKADSW